MKEQLESGALHNAAYAREIEQLKAERDELLTAMQDAVSWFKQLQDWSGVGDPNLDQYLAAIAKAKGEEYKPNRIDRNREGVEL
jgi:hypothetical protein